MGQKAFRKGWIQKILIGDRSGSYQKINSNCCYCIQGQPIQDELNDGTDYVQILVSAYVSKNAFKNRVPPLNQSPFVYFITDAIPATDGVSLGLFTQYFSSGDVWTNSINLLNTVDGTEAWHKNDLLNLKPASTLNPGGSTDA